MRVPLSWLRPLVPGLTADATHVAEALVRAGLEVEQVHRYGHDVQGVVVGKVLDVEELAGHKKPVRYCHVDVGDRVHEVVCGATNFDVGDLVPFATPGANLPGGFRIATRQTYGRVSDGMICSAAELGLADESAGILVLPADSPLGVDVVELLQLRDEVLDIAITPDRGYTLSIRGVAREVATAFDLPFTDPALQPVPSLTGGYDVRLPDPGCDRYVARTVEGFDPTAQSPVWLQRRLRLAGMRPISLAVDVTNHVMLELGQPLHAFDLDALQGAIVVRRAKAGERLTTLDGQDRALDPDDLLITDDRGPIALAGVMGGASTEISDGTTRILLESAHFAPSSVTRTARRHRLPSEASKRFERGVDPELSAAAAEAAVTLLAELGGATARLGTDVDQRPARSVLVLPVAKPGKVAGVAYDRRTVVHRLEQVGCEVAGDDPLEVTPPPWRPDLTGQAELVEEVIRLEGYDSVPVVLPVAPAGRGLTPGQRLRRTASRALAGAGLCEVVTPPFVAEGVLETLGQSHHDAPRLLNPLSEEEALLRPSMLPGLLTALQRNVGRGLHDVALFETGSVFRGSGRLVAEAPRTDGRPSAQALATLDAALPEQPRMAGLALAGRRSGRPVEVGDAVESLLSVARALGLELTVARGDEKPYHPGRCALLLLDGQAVGTAGELHPRTVTALGLPPRTVAAEVDLDVLVAAAIAAGPERAPVVSPYPPSSVDVALVVDEGVLSMDVERTLRSAAGELLEHVWLFDVYTGPQVGVGKKSLAYSLRFRAPDRTLTDGEVLAARDAAVAAAGNADGAVLRCLNDRSPAVIGRPVDHDSEPQPHDCESQRVRMVLTVGQWSQQAMATATQVSQREHVTTFRRLSVTVAAGLAFALVPAPSHADSLVDTYIVTYSGPPSVSQLGVLRGITDAVHGFTNVPAAVVVAPAGTGALLRHLPGVRGVYPNTRYQWLSDLATQSTGANRVWQDLGWTGEGVGIAIIDAGVDGAHPDLCAAAVFCKGTPVKTVQNVKVIGRQDVVHDPVVYLEDQISTDSSSGHGSHVAGIAAGFGSAGSDPTKYRGVAPGANLIGYGTGEAVEAVNVLGAFDHAITHRDQYNIKVINNSWGPGAFTPYDPGDPVNLAIDAAWNVGISVAFGAGNDGTRTDSLNMFSENPHVIGVGSGTKAHQQSFFSSKGVPGHPQFHPTVSTPGESIVSVRATTGFTMAAADAQTAGGGDADTPAAGSNDQLYYAASSGTSMASPHAVGVVALMQQAAHTSLGRWLTPMEVRNILQNTASTMPGYQTYSVGAGFVNALAATQAAMTASSTQDWVDPTVFDVTPYAGSVGPGAVLSTGTFSSSHVVLPGATILDVMADWGPEKVLPANTDVDIDLIRPDGSTFARTFLACSPAAQPNGYSSFCSSAPNERLTVVNPAPGTWTVNVHSGLASGSEAVRGLWSVGYPRGTALPSTAPPAALTLDAGAVPVQLAGQTVALTATVRDAAGLPLPNVPVTWTSSGVGAVSRTTTVSDSYGRVRGQASSSAPGTQTITASAGGVSKSASLTWVGVSVPALPCLLPCPPAVQDSNGKASVGGWFVVGGAKHHVAATAEHTAGAATTSGELRYDDKAGTKVVGTGVEHLVISGVKATITGTATVNGTSGYRYSLVITDNGEPGSSDTVQLTVTQPGTSWELTDGGTLGGGNAQVQPT